MSKTRKIRRARRARELSVAEMVAAQRDAELSKEKAIAAIESANRAEYAIKIICDELRHAGVSRTSLISAMAHGGPKSLGEFPYPEGIEVLIMERGGVNGFMKAVRAISLMTDVQVDDLNSKVYITAEHERRAYVAMSHRAMADIPTEFLAKEVLSTLIRQLKEINRG